METPAEQTSLTRLVVSYYDDSSPDVVVCGMREFILAERKFGVGAIAASNMDALAYAAYLAAKRSKIVAEGVSYDAWLENVAMIGGTEDEAAGESPAPPA